MIAIVPIYQPIESHGWLTGIEMQRDRYRHQRCRMILPSGLSGYS